MVNIHNIRFGFATNSSSSHSIVICNNPVSDELYDPFMYGWEWFVLATRKRKLEYMATQLGVNLQHLIGKPYVSRLVQSLTGIRLPEKFYIDHQSVLYLPRNWDGTFINIEFFEELKNYLLQDNIAIHGGNDNSESSYSIPNSTVIPLPFYKLCDLGFYKSVMFDSSIVARKDKQYNYWTIFNRRNGQKIRFSFSEG